MSDVEGLTTEQRDDVLVLALDDGRANALTPAVVAELTRLLDEARTTARAVLLLGRPGRLSAGFDLDVMRGAPEGRAQLVGAGRELLLQMFRSEVPIVVGCTGHALAAGAGLLVASDLRVGARGAFKLGFNEVAIGHPLTGATVEMIRHRMPATAFEAIVRGEVFDPERALAAGLLDRLVDADELPAVAEEEARRLAALDRDAYRTVKRHARRPAWAAIEQAIAEETAG
jgi:enoyl-CoA hydratase